MKSSSSRLSLVIYPALFGLQHIVLRCVTLMLYSSAILVTITVLVTWQWPLRRSRSFKVTDFVTDRKLICDFLLLINSNLPPILHRFRDMVLQRSKIAIFDYPSSV